MVFVTAGYRVVENRQRTERVVVLIWFFACEGVDGDLWHCTRRDWSSALELRSMPPRQYESMLVASESLNGCRDIELCNVHSGGGGVSLLSLVVPVPRRVFCSTLQTQAIANIVTQRRTAFRNFRHHQRRPLHFGLSMTTTMTTRNPSGNAEAVVANATVE